MAHTIQKGINIWSFDQSLSLETCMRMAKDAGFEGIELALAAKGPLSMESTDEDILAIRRTAEDIGIRINALATGLYWQYSLTSNREDIREKAKAVARREMEIGKLLGISKERTRQIEHQALEKLRQRGTDLGLEDFLE